MPDPADPKDQQLAAYATLSCCCGGREHAEAEDSLRSPFELDRHRIIGSTAFRRLEGKAQVFLASRHDHFRTRLTHTIEVAQVSRILASALQANADLAEAIALAHDLGHPPFGHAGEAALGRALADAGGFNHNTHSLRVVEYLEHPFPPFRGLNLTGATRAGMANHATRYDRPETLLPARASGPSVEAQVASLADRMAYNCHDLEDAIGAELIGLDDLNHVTLWQSAFDRAQSTYGCERIHAIRRVVLNSVLDTLLSDVMAHSRKALAPIQSPEDVAAATEPLVGLSPDVDRQLGQLEQFLSERVYRHEEVARADAACGQRIVELFGAYRSDPTALPPRFASRIDDQGLDPVIADYIAGMTDRFCQREHERLVKPTS